MDLYLDHNVITDLMKGNPALWETISHLKSNGARVIYSPAHIEEVAVILRETSDIDKGKRFVREHLRFISAITDDWEYRPTIDGPTCVVREKPSVCYKRVMAEYDLTLEAEEINRFARSLKSENAFNEVQQEYGTGLRVGHGIPLDSEFRARYGIDPKVIGNIPPERLFDEPHILEAFNADLRNKSLSVTGIGVAEHLAESHMQRQTSVTLTMNFLERIGFFADKFDKFRSQMHDVTHAIYGSAADIFITRDQHLLYRLRAAYTLLRVPTRVLSVVDHETLTNP